MYYVRFTVPKSIISLVGKRIIRYSLGTRDFNKALILLNIESAAFDGFIEGIEQMRIEKDKLYLSDNDLHAFILARMADVYERYTHYRGGIVAKHFGYDAVKWFDADSDDRKTAWNKIESKYTKYLSEEAKHNNMLSETVQKLSTGELHFASITSKNDENQEHKLWGDYLYRMLRRIERHTQQTFEAIVNGTKYDELDEEINDLIKTVKNRKTDKLAEAQTEIELDWKVVWKEIKDEKLDGKHIVSKKDIKTKGNNLRKMFDFIGKTNLHQITEDDVEKLQEFVFNLKGPKGDFLAAASMNTYIRAYNGVIRRAVKKHKLKNLYLLESIPKHEAQKPEQPRTDFDESNLIKIFLNEKYLKNRYNYMYFAYFWIPLISLYTGFRLSEISQLQINDIYKDTNINHYCFKITTLDEKGNKTKKIKTPNAKRTIPVHPILIKIGLLDFWKQIKKMKKYRHEWCEIHSGRIKPTRTKDDEGIYEDNIYEYKYDENNFFFTLNITNDEKNSGRASKWVNRHIKNVGVNFSELGEKRVLHSFRHTFTSAVIDKNDGLTELMVNKVMGWANGKMVERYGHTTLKKTKKIVFDVSYPKFERKLKALLPDPEKSKVFDK